MAADYPDHTKIVKQGMPVLLATDTQYHKYAVEAIAADTTTITDVYTVPAAKKLNVLASGVNIQYNPTTVHRYALYTASGKYFVSTFFNRDFHKVYGTGAYFSVAAGDTLRRLVQNTHATAAEIFRSHISGVEVDV